MSEFAKRKGIIFVFSALILSNLLPYWQVRSFDFVGYDDNEYVYENPHVSKGLTADGIIWAFTAFHASNWHTLTWLSHMLDCTLFGKNPGPMHLVNVLLHIINTLLLFTILLKMTAVLWQSAFVAAAFALHPMHVESVAWIAERKDVLSTMFWLLTMLAYVGHVKKPSLGRYIFTLIIFALGLMSKPMLVTLPFVLLLLDYWPLNRFSTVEFRLLVSSQQSAPGNRQFLRLIYEKIPFFILASISSVITFLAQRVGGAMAAVDILPLTDRIANGLLSYARYILKFFWPRDLSVFYPYDVLNIRSISVVMSLLFLIVLTILVIWLSRKRKYLLVGWLWFAVTLLPVIGIVQVGAAAYADRYTYIPYTGLFIILTWGLSELFLNWRYKKVILETLAAIVLVIFGIIGHQQVGFWKDGITVFSHAIEITRNNTLAYYNLGTAFLDRGCYLDAIDSFKQVIKIKPDYANALYNLGCAYDKLGHTEEAIATYHNTIKVKPNLMQAYINLGIAYRNLGNYQQAIETYQAALKINPDFTDAYVSLGVVCNDLGRFQDAVYYWKQALVIRPDYAEVYSNLGVAFYQLGRYQEAIESFKKAIKIKPGYIEAHSNLGKVYLLTGDKTSAIEEYKILKALDAIQAEQLYILINK